MVMYGTNIQSSADELKKIPEEQLFNSLRNPKPAIANTIRQLRIVYAMDTQRYNQLKRQLPYFVCGQFTPPYRRKENFAFTETFILDIDHLSAKELSLPSVRQELFADPRVLMCFASPSQDGLKVMFRLKERCYDAGLFSLFYRAFAATFASQHHLSQVIDTKTCDVSRACFISTDPNACYNPLCDTVDLSTLIDTANPTSVFDTKHELDRHEKMAAGKGSSAPAGPKDPDHEVLDRIRCQPNPQARPQREAPPAFVPQLLNDIIGDIKTFIEQTGMVVTEIINIQYAKKIRAKVGLKEAEVNLFYGRKGFSVVISPRRGTSEELNELLAQLVNQFLLTC